MLYKIIKRMGKYSILLYESSDREKVAEEFEEMTKSKEEEWIDEEGDVYTIEEESTSFFNEYE